MADPSDDPATLGDRELVARIRDGSDGAAMELRRRHLHALQTVAAGYHRHDRDRDASIDATIAELGSPSVPEPTADGEVIITLFALIRAHKAPEGSEGKGPWGLADLVNGDSGNDPVERDVLIEAYGTLDERDQVLLWFSSVDGVLPPQLADRLSIKGADLAATLAHRARTRLRESYARLRAQKAGWAPACVTMAPDLARIADGDPASSLPATGADHLGGCPNCAILLGELAALPTQLLGVVARVEQQLTSGAVVPDDAVAAAAPDLLPTAAVAAAATAGPMVVSTTPMLSDEPPGAPPGDENYVDTDEPSRRRTGVIVGVAVGVVALIAAVAIWAATGDSSSKPVRAGAGGAPTTSSTSTSSTSTSSSTTTSTSSTSTTTSSTTTTTSPPPAATDPPPTQPIWTPPPPTAPPPTSGTTSPPPTDPPPSTNPTTTTTSTTTPDAAQSTP